MQQKKFLHNIFKYMFLMFLTLKTITIVYEQVTIILDEKLETSLNLEFNEEDFDNEVEKLELSEFEYIKNSDYKITIYIQKEKKVNYFFSSIIYQKKYIDFSTPPPDFI